MGHHSRDAEFTCLDFEWGPTLAQQQSRSEVELLKRVYVANKQGMIFVINYETGALESTQRANGACIRSIAVTENYCVTGDEDSNLSVWGFDFSDVFLSTKLESAVC